MAAARAALEGAELTPALRELVDASAEPGFFASSPSAVAYSGGSAPSPGAAPPAAPSLTPASQPAAGARPEPSARAGEAPQAPDLAPGPVGFAQVMAALAAAGAGRGPANAASAAAGGTGEGSAHAAEGPAAGSAEEGTTGRGAREGRPRQTARGGGAAGGVRRHGMDRQRQRQPVPAALLRLAGA